MKNDHQDGPIIEIEAFAAAERALAEAGIGFTVVDGPTREAAEPLLAA